LILSGEKVINNPKRAMGRGLHFRQKLWAAGCIFKKSYGLRVAQPPMKTGALE